MDSDFISVRGKKYKKSYIPEYIPESTLERGVDERDDPFTLPFNADVRNLSLSAKEESREAFKELQDELPSFPNVASFDEFDDFEQAVVEWQEEVERIIHEKRVVLNTIMGTQIYSLDYIAKDISSTNDFYQDAKSDVPQDALSRKDTTSIAPSRDQQLHSIDQSEDKSNDGSTTNRLLASNLRHSTCLDRTIADFFDDEGRIDLSKVAGGSSWESQLMLAAPKPVYYDTYEEFEVAYKRWSVLTSRDVRIVPPHPRQLTHLINIQQVTQNKTVKPKKKVQFRYFKIPIFPDERECWRPQPAKKEKRVLISNVPVPDPGTIEEINRIVKNGLLQVCERNRVLYEDFSGLVLGRYRTVVESEDEDVDSGPVRLRNDIRTKDSRARMPRFNGVKVKYYVPEYDIRFNLSLRGKNEMRDQVTDLMFSERKNRYMAKYNGIEVDPDSVESRDVMHLIKSSKIHLDTFAKVLEPGADEMLPTLRKVKDLFFNTGSPLIKYKIASYIELALFHAKDLPDKDEFREFLNDPDSLELLSFALSTCMIVPYDVHLPMKSTDPVYILAKKLFYLSFLARPSSSQYIINRNLKSLFKTMLQDTSSSLMDTIEKTKYIDEVLFTTRGIKSTSRSISFTHLFIILQVSGLKNVRNRLDVVHVFEKIFEHLSTSRYTNVLFVTKLFMKKLKQFSTHALTVFDTTILQSKSDAFPHNDVKKYFETYIQKEISGKDILRHDVTIKYSDFEQLCAQKEATGRYDTKNYTIKTHVANNVMVYNVPPLRFLLWLLKSVANKNYFDHKVPKIVTKIEAYYYQLSNTSLFSRDLYDAVVTDIRKKISVEETYKDVKGLKTVVVEHARIVLDRVIRSFLANEKNYFYNNNQSPIKDFRGDDMTTLLAFTKYAPGTKFGSTALKVVTLLIRDSDVVFDEEIHSQLVSAFYKLYSVSEHYGDHVDFSMYMWEFIYLLIVRNERTVDKIEELGGFSSIVSGFRSNKRTLFSYFLLKTLCKFLILPLRETLMLKEFEKARKKDKKKAETLGGRGLSKVGSVVGGIRRFDNGSRRNLTMSEMNIESEMRSGKKTVVVKVGRSPLFGHYEFQVRKPVRSHYLTQKNGKKLLLASIKRDVSIIMDSVSKANFFATLGLLYNKYSNKTTSTGDDKGVVLFPKIVEFLYMYKVTPDNRKNVKKIEKDKSIQALLRKVKKSYEF